MALQLHPSVSTKRILSSTRYRVAFNAEERKLRRDSGSNWRQHFRINDAQQLNPFKLALVKTELELCVESPAALQGLTEIGIPSRKTLARHTGQLYSIRGRCGGARSGGAYRRIGQTSGRSQSRRALRVTETLRFFFSSTLAHSSASVTRLLCARAVSRAPACNRC